MRKQWSEKYKLWKQDFFDGKIGKKSQKKPLFDKELLLCKRKLFMYVDKLTALQAGFFRANPHQVAFHGRFERRFNALVAAKNIVELSDDENVAAAVTVACFRQLIDIVLLRSVYVVQHFERIGDLVQNHFSVRAVEYDSSAAVRRVARHRQTRFYAVFKGHLRKLMVYDVVIATVNASPVIPLFE